MTEDASDHRSNIELGARSWRIACVLALVAAIVLAAVFAPPFAQPETYHRFADQRSLLGIPNFLDVVSNLAFLAVGVTGLHFVRGQMRTHRSSTLETNSDRWGWGIVFAAVVLGSLGSVSYHWAPDSPRLAWDRLPMAVGFMSLVAVVVAERINAKAGLILLAPLCLLGATSV